MYLIYLLKNKINRKIYIGKTNNLYKRLSAHKNDRRSITHLTNAIDKYGIDNFECQIIEENISKEKIKEKEIFYIKEFDSYKSNNYNSTAGGDGFLSGKDHPFYGKKRPKEVIKKISQTKKKNHPFKGKKIPWLKGPPFGEKHFLAKEYIVTSPEGKEFRIKGINDFCRKNNLSPQLMCKVSKGLRNHHKKWKCIEVGRCKNGQ